MSTLDEKHRSVAFLMVNNLFRLLQKIKDEKNEKRKIEWLQKKRERSKGKLMI
jgi:hypothetical protein